MPRKGFNLIDISCGLASTDMRKGRATSWVEKIVVAELGGGLLRGFWLDGSPSGGSST